MDKWDVGFHHDGPRGWLRFPENITGQGRESAFKAYNELSRAAVREVCLDFSLTQFRGWSVSCSIRTLRCPCLCSLERPKTASPSC